MRYGMDDSARRSHTGRSLDFRTALYDKYVSSFKTPRPQVGEGSFGWWDRKYLHLLAGLERDAHVLEIGCGSGALLAYLKRRGFSHASGIDISQEQVALAQQHGVDVQRVDALEHLATPPRLYSAILAVDVLEHFARDELQMLAANISGALQPGGRLLVQTANGAGLLSGGVIYGDLTHLTIFTPQSLGQLLRPVGFDKLSFFETGPVPIRLRGKFDVVVWRAITTLARAAKYVETGKSQAIWTENFICCAFKR